MSITTQIAALSGTVSTIIPFNPKNDKLVAIDLTKANNDLKPEVVNNIDAFSLYIQNYLKDRKATYVIGGYNEHRTVYSKSELFDTNDEEPRRLHLGVDIWGEENTPIMAPVAGSVHSFANNDGKGDYGGTIILKHEIDDVVFYSLYGHLSLSSLDNKQIGQTVNAGETIAWLGNHYENGDWPPHLHFQLINDIGSYKGDYPGVCKYSEKEQWLSNSPDPDLLIRMNQFIQ